MRAPDLAYIATSRLGKADTVKFIPIPPDRTVEALSPDALASKVAEKVRWWLGHDVRLL